MSNLKYRADIDGLRALAVISVILFHLNENWLTGGFLGVDIFFVISGYLITKIIVSEMQANTFSFAHFYNRRIKRIYPVFILTMALITIFASLIFIYNDYNQLRQTIEAATAFVSNFYLANTQGYFDLNASENPVLHIWSLAVEEQYYLIFPLLFYFSYKKSGSIEKLSRIALIIFIVLTLISFLPNAWFSKIGIMDNYYNSLIRFPEMLVGSLLALFTLKNKHTLNNSLISTLSFILLLATLIFYQSNLPFIPGITLIIPTVLTALLILTAENTFIGKILSLKPIVFIGKISYSLYLFHWLFIAFTFYITGAKNLSIQTACIIVALTFLSSVLSYFLIEKPIRASKLSFKQSFIFLYLIPSLCVIGYGLYMRKIIDVRTDNFGHTAFTLEENKHTPTIAIIGDSHSGHLKEFLDYVGNKEGWKADFMKTQECFDFLLNDKYKGKLHSQECIEMNKSLDSDKYNTIIFSLFYDLKLGNKPVPRFAPHRFIVTDFDKKFVETIKHFTAQNKKVIVMGDLRVLSRSPLRNALIAQYGFDKYLSPITELADSQKTNQHIENLVKDLPHVKFVNPYAVLGDQYMVDGKPIYFDQDHITSYGSYYLGVEFSKKYKLLD